jgi:DNA-binding transcriptional MerR regulator
MGSYRISQLAERAGVLASTLRFYESAGLMPATARTAAGYRVYDDDALRRLEFIGSAKQLGLPLDEVAELLQVWQDGVCATVRSELLPLVRARIDQTDRRIAELTAFGANLADVHEELSGPAPAGACEPGCGCVGGPDASKMEPVACSLDGSSMTGRVQDWHQLLTACTSRESITDGLRLGFPADPALAVEITRLAAAEQDCCPFFDFTLRLTPTSVVLSVRAPDAGADVLAELFGATV